MININNTNKEKESVVSVLLNIDSMFIVNCVKNS